jgi:hypothetical protein
MRHAVGDLLRHVLEGSKLDPQSVLWGILIGAAILSLLHLITMFATRWGDHRVTGKALLFSLMLHFGCLVGVVTVAPAPPALPPGDPDGGEQAHRVVIRSVKADADRDLGAGADVGESGQIPVWDRIPVAKNIKQLGRERKLPPAAAAPSVDRLAQSLKSPELPLPDSAALPDVPQPPSATPVQVAPSTQKQTAQTPEIETPKAAPLAKADSATAPKPAERSTAPTTAATTVERQSIAPPDPSLVPSDSGRLEPSTSPDSPAPVPQATVANVPSAETTRRDAAPAPTPQIDRNAGVTQTPVASTMGTRSSSQSSISVPQSGALSGMVVGRLPSNELSTSGASGSSQTETARPDDYQSVDDRPSPAVQGAGSGAEPLIVKRSAGVAPTYRLRKLSNRRENARQFGGNEQSERSVEASLRWLASVQNRDGHWDAKAFGAGRVKIDENGVDRDYAGRDADSGVTALCVLAFLGAGYTHEEGQYSDTVDRALRWLIGQQKSDGNLGADAGHFAMHYCHAIATYAIAEAYGMQNDPTSNTMLREPLLRGVRYILSIQDPDGGWRYLKGQKSDISMTGWQLMALKSAEIAGVNIPRSAKADVVSFLKARSLGTYGGLAGYREEMPPSATMTAEAMFCKQMLGMRRDNAAAREAAEYLLARLPVRTSFNEYYWYYGTLAMYQFGGEGWNTWNAAIRDLLISEQRTDGENAGSWDPVGPWAQYGGRIYSTALSTLCLEVYYRFLPLYQLGSAPEGAKHE